MCFFKFKAVKRDIVSNKKLPLPNLNPSMPYIGMRGY
jgi:hypothetical protein